MAERFWLSELGGIEVLATLLSISPRQKLQESVGHVKFNTDSEVFLVPCIFIASSSSKARLHSIESRNSSWFLFSKLKFLVVMMRCGPRYPAFGLLRQKNKFYQS
jgi:hypothetical protein